MPEGSLHRIIRIGGDRLIAPEPAHHFRENGPALFLTVIANAPDVVHVITLHGQRLHQPHVLKEPVPVGVARSAIVVPPVLHENTNGFLLTLRHEFGLNVFTANAGETSNEGNDLAEIVRSEPGHGEGSAPSGTGAHDPVQIRIG